MPYKDADAETQARFLAGLKRRGLDGNPDWHCTLCGENTAGDDILITYNVETPVPQCPTKPEQDRICAGFGPDLVPAADEGA